MGAPGAVAGPGLLTLFPDERQGPEVGVTRPRPPATERAGKRGKGWFFWFQSNNTTVLRSMPGASWPQNRRDTLLPA